MDAINEKLLNKIYSDESFAINIYESLELKAFDTFYSQELINDMLITNEDYLFFMANSCEHIALIEKIWLKDEYDIVKNLLSMSNKKIAMKFCKFSMLSKDKNKAATCFSLKKILSILPKDRISSFKKEIIEQFLKISENDVFPILMEHNILTSKDFIIFSENSDSSNKTIIEIISKYKRHTSINISNKIKMLNDDFEKETNTYSVGKNIKFKNDLVSLKELLKINHNTISLNDNETSILFRISKHFNDTQLFSLVNKIRLSHIFIDTGNNKIFKERL